MYLKSRTNAQVGPTVKSDLNGRFVVPRQANGTYQVCWNTVGFVAGCSPDAVSINNATAYPKPAQVTPENGVIAGRVTLADKSPCRFLDPAFQVDLVTNVTLLDATTNASIETVRANNLGDYLLPKAPDKRLTVRATCEASTVEAATGPGGLIDLILPNSRPIITSVVAFSATGAGVRTAAQGANLTVRAIARHPNGIPLQYRWRASADGGGFVSADAPSVAWPLPKTSGLHIMYVLVSDGKGGYALAHVEMPTDGRGVPFSAIVVDAAGGAPIANASIDVNGATTSTNAQGFFFVYVPKETSRYVLNIGKAAYEPISKVSNEGIVGARYRMHRAEPIAIDATRQIDVAERVAEGRQRTQVIIAPGSLVDRAGKLASGPLTLEVSTVDLHDPLDRWPGDGSGINAQGREAALTPYGTAHIEVRDAAGNLYNLQPGKTAIVRITVDPAQKAAGPLPASTPAWTYDRSTGMWKEDGVFKLVNNAYYEATVTHFSELNVDVQKTGPAACMRVHTDATIPIPYNMRLTVPATATTAQKQVTKLVDNALSVIIQLPPNTPNVKVAVLDTNGNVVATPGGTVTFASGGGITNHHPDYPYTDCGATADIFIGLTTPPPPAAGFLTIVGTDDNTSGNAYYTAIDPPTPGQPNGLKSTLTEWKAVNGFGTAGEVETSAAYLNAADLNLGRLMNVHARNPANPGDPVDVAYYVSNYGLPPNLGSADFAAAAKLCVDAPTPGCNIADHLLATVAMEYTAAPSGGARYTKFYVFNAAGTRVNRADLDGHGDKYVPSLCVQCHASDYPPSHYNATTHVWDNNGNLNARFIPFDVPSFGYSGLATSVSQSGQQASFNKLNAQILNTNASDAVNKLVHGWYGVNVGTAIPPGAAFDPTWVPTGDWRTPAAHVGLYTPVVATSCRNCHATRGVFIDWNTYSSIHDDPLVKNYVCVGHLMPQAQVTFNNFWLSTAPNRPATLSAGGLSSFSTPTCP